jgi:hypothetical protein
MLADEIVWDRLNQLWSFHRRPTLRLVLNLNSTSPEDCAGR